MFTHRAEAPRPVPSRFVRRPSWREACRIVFAVLFAWVLLGQLPTVVQLAGGVVVLAGIALVRLDELRAPAAAVVPAPAAEREFASR